MGYKRYQLSLPTDYREEDLLRLLRKESGLTEFRYAIEKKSLDARKKREIHWLLSIVVISDQLPGESWTAPAPPHVPKRRGPCHVVVVGSGPAGIFSALVLAEAGCSVTVIERGSRIEKRKRDIDAFEADSIFPLCNNYAFGEGGAGAFSDGKLTSRSKHIGPERALIHKAFIEAGAPEEIAWLAHPHLGSDNLFRITRALRAKVETLGGSFAFDTFLEGFTPLSAGGFRLSCKKSIGGKGSEIDGMECDYLIVACGHSADDTIAMMIHSGVPYRTKNFALGFRVEHEQRVINHAQWGSFHVPGVKAAEYRLTAADNVYTFCMCPGGRVVPAAAFSDRNIVNGMSNYYRDGRFANAAVVAGLHPDQLAGRPVSPLEALELLADLERRFVQVGNAYAVPAASISAFLAGKAPGILPQESSYPFPLIPADPEALYPELLLPRLRRGLAQFCSKIRGFDTGTILGLESRTSSSVQVLRDRDGSIPQFPGLFVVGEASGWAGGIVSSAADGIRAAMTVVGT